MVPVWYALPVKLLLSTCLLLIGAGLQAAPQQWLLGADTWERSRDGLTITQMSPLPEVVSAWSAKPGQRLLIRYPGGERGQLWAYELRSWLVSLGIPLQSQELVAGSEQAEQIELELSR